MPGPSEILTLSKTPVRDTSALPPWPSHKHSSTPSGPQAVLQDWGSGFPVIWRLYIDWGSERRREEVAPAGMLPMLQPGRALGAPSSVALALRTARRPHR